MRTPTLGFQPGSSLLAASFTVCVFAVLLLLGTAVGLFTVSVADGALSFGDAGIFAVLGAGLALVVSFFLGGFFASRLAATDDRIGAVHNGLSVWTAASFFLLCVGGSAFWGQLTKVQLGLGAAANAEAFLDAMTQMDIRLVSDVAVLKGKAVTSLTMDRPKDRIVRKTAKELGKLGVLAADTVEQKPARLATITKEAQGKAARAALALFAGLMLAAAAALFGSEIGVRYVRRKVA